MVYIKWFKHDTDAGNDPRIKKVKHKFGLAGYGLYFHMLELMSRKVEADLEHIGLLPDEWDTESLEIEFGLPGDHIEEMINYMVTLELFTKVDGRLYNDKIKERCDEYTQKLIKKAQFNESTAVKSRQDTDTVGTKSDNVPLRIDKIREDKILNNGKSADAPLLKKNETTKTTNGVSSVKDLLAKRAMPTPQPSGINYAWQEKALRYAEELRLELGPHARARWMKMFKQASEGRKTDNLEKAHTFLVDHPKVLSGEMSNEQKMMFFFKIYEAGTGWMQS